MDQGEQECSEPPKPLLAAALGTILLADAVIIPRARRRVSLGVADETAHLATGTIVLAGLRRCGPFAAGVIAGSVLLDIDHMPEVLGLRLLRRNRRLRPLTHSGVLPALIVLGADLARHGASRELARGAAVGLTAHLGRDLATGATSVPLLWPISKRPFTMRYALYAGALAWAAGRAGSARRGGVLRERV